LRAQNAHKRERLARVIRADNLGVQSPHSGTASLSFRGEVIKVENKRAYFCATVIICKLDEKMRIKNAIDEAL
jgi:hypothetical protein